MGKLIAEISKGEQLRASTAHAGASLSSVAPLQSKQALQDVKQFVLSNNVANISQHPAYAACLSRVRAAFCQCPRSSQDWNPSQTCDFHDACHTLQDMMWGFARLLEQENIVPDAITDVGAAAVALAASLAEAAEKAHDDHMMFVGLQVGKSRCALVYV